MKMGTTPPDYAVVEPFPHFPTAWWFLAVYVCDVVVATVFLLAVWISPYGYIMKVKFNQKACCKLQGKAVNTACWATIQPEGLL